MPMRVAVNVQVNSLAEMIKFYVEEMNLFEISRDYGMGTILISYKRNSDFGLMLNEVEDLSEVTSIFIELEVENCEAEFENAKKSLTNSRGYIYSKDGSEPRVFEYPVGQNFLVIDPLKNKILIFEDYGSKGQ